MSPWKAFEPFLWSRKRHRKWLQSLSTRGITGNIKGACVTRYSAKLHFFSRTYDRIFTWNVLPSHQNNMPIRNPWRIQGISTNKATPRINNRGRRCLYGKCCARSSGYRWEVWCVQFHDSVGDTVNVDCAACVVNQVAPPEAVLNTEPQLDSRPVHILWLLVRFRREAYPSSIVWNWSFSSEVQPL